MYGRCQKLQCGVLPKHEVIDDIAGHALMYSNDHLITDEGLRATFYNHLLYCNVLVDMFYMYFAA